MNFELLAIGLVAMGLFAIQTRQIRADAASRILWHDRFLATMRAERQRERRFLLELAQLTASAKTARSAFEMTAAVRDLKEESVPEVPVDARPSATFKLDGTGEEVSLVHGFEDLMEGAAEKKS